MIKKINTTTVHVVPAFHYDVAYQKTFREYLPQCFDNLKSALELLDRHGDYTYCVEQVILLREYWNAFPEDRKKIRCFASQGRLFCAPGMFTMPDVNIPSGENFIRNALIGREWLQENLGITPDCCWMADIFGHHPQMPQLGKTCGFKSYMFERGKCGSWNTTFLWKGIDGTTLPAHWEIDTYFGLGMALAWQKSRPADWVENRAMQEIINPLKENSPMSDTLLTPLGGDFMKPTEEHVQFIRNWNKKHKELKLKFSTPEAYFSALQNRAAKLQIEKEDLNPLCEGCYSSRIRLKQYNRRLEESAATLEALESMAGSGHKDSEAVWEALAFNAFHDIICGSLVRKAGEEALEKYRRTEKFAENKIKAIMSSIVNTNRGSENPRSVKKGMHRDYYDTIGNKTKASPLAGNLFFNSLPYPRKEIIELSRTFAEVNLPPLGMAFVADKEAAGKSSKSGVKLCRARRTLENEKIKITFGINGTVVSLCDKENSHELAVAEKGMNNPLMTPDAGDLWMIDGNINSGLLRNGPFHNPMPLSSGGSLIREGRLNRRGADADCFNWPTMNVIHEHQLQATVEFSYPEIGFKTQVSLRKGEKLVRFRSIFMPKGKRYRLQSAFPTSIKNGKIRHSIPCGHIRRPEGEYAAQGWIDYADKEKGLLMVNKGLPGNNVTNGVMMLSLFRSISMDKAEKIPWYEEGIEHVFEYGIMPFSPADKTYNPAREAALFNRELYTLPGYDVPEEFLKRSPMLEIEGDGAELTCLRRENGGLLLRLWESRGRHSKIKCIFPDTIKSCFKMNSK